MCVSVHVPCLTPKVCMHEFIKKQQKNKPYFQNYIPCSRNSPSPGDIFLHFLKTWPFHDSVQSKPPGLSSTLKVSRSGASPPRDGPSRRHAPHSRLFIFLFFYIFIFYLLRWLDVRKVLDEVPQGGSATEEFSVKTIPGPRRSCVDRGDFLSLKPPSESSVYALFKPPLGGWRSVI